MESLLWEYPENAWQNWHLNLSRNHIAFNLHEIEKSHQVTGIVLHLPMDQTA